MSAYPSSSFLENSVLENILMEDRRNVYKDTSKSSLKLLYLDMTTWEEPAENHSTKYGPIHKAIKLMK